MRSLAIYYLGVDPGVKFVEIRFDAPIPVDRDDVEDEINDVLSGIGEVTGAGVGEFGAHLDVDLNEEHPEADVLGKIFGVMNELGISDAVRVRPGGREVWIRPSEWPPAAS
jgi:hypothetical protein